MPNKFNLEQQHPAVGVINRCVRIASCNIRIYKSMSEVGYYMRVAIDINKKVGGTRAYEAEANNRDRFIVIREQINKNFHFIRTKLEERERRRGQDATMINAEVREKIEEIYSQLQRMREAVASEKASNPEAQRVKYSLIEKLAAQTQELQELLDTSSDLDRKLLNRGKGETYTEMRQQLLEPGKKNNRIISTQGRSQNATEMELQKIKEWKKVDEQIDRQIDEVLGGIKRWKEGLMITGKLIEDSDKKIVQLTSQVDKVNEDLFRSNKQLKGIIQKMRKPHKFCIDVVLVLILIALIVAIVKMSSSN